MDSNNDTCCVGASFIGLSMTRRTENVFPYDSNNYQPLHNVPIVTAATAYDEPNTNNTYILVLNECLSYGMKLEPSLFNPNQLRHFGVDVWDNAYDPHHPLSIECHNDNMTTPLSTKGTKVYFTTQFPTDEELNHCHHIQLTSLREWNPKSIKLSIRSVKAVPIRGWNVQRQVSAYHSSQGQGYPILYEYNDIKSDKSTIHQIEPTLVKISELLTEQKEA